MLLTALMAVHSIQSTKQATAPRSLAIKAASSVDFSSISVTIPFHNWARKHPLQQTIKRVLFQLYPGDIEIILINTNNPNAAEELQNATKSRRHPNRSDVPLRVLRATQPPGTWAGWVRNQGIRIVQGAYVAFLNSDDAYLPNGWETLWKFARLYGTTDFFGGEALAATTCRLP